MLGWNGEVSSRQFGAVLVVDQDLDARAQRQRRSPHCPVARDYNAHESSFLSMRWVVTT